MKNIEPKIIAELLMKEHPQIIVLILLNLNDNDLINKILNQYPIEFKSELLYRMGNTKNIDSTLINDITSIFNKNLEILMKNQTQVNGETYVKQIINSMDNIQQKQVKEYLLQIDEIFTKIKFDNFVINIIDKYLWNSYNFKNDIHLLFDLKSKVAINVTTKENITYFLLFNQNITNEIDYFCPDYEKMELKVKLLLKQLYKIDNVETIKFYSDSEMEYHDRGFNIQNEITKYLMDEEYVFDYSAEKKKYVNIKVTTNNNQIVTSDLIIFKMLKKQNDTSKYKCDKCNGNGFVYSNLNKIIDENHPLLFCSTCNGIGKNKYKEEQEIYFKKMEEHKINDEKKQILKEKNLDLLKFYTLESNVPVSSNLDNTNKDFVSFLGNSLLKNVNTNLTFAKNDFIIKDINVYNPYYEQDINIVENEIHLKNQVQRKYIIDTTKGKQTINVNIPFFTMCYLSNINNKIDYESISNYELTNRNINKCYKNMILNSLKDLFVDKTINISSNQQDEKDNFIKGQTIKINKNKLIEFVITDKNEIQFYVYFEISNELFDELSYKFFEEQKKVEIDNYYSNINNENIEDLRNYVNIYKTIDNNKKHQSMLDPKLLSLIEINIYENSKKERFYNNLKAK